MEGKKKFPPFTPPAAGGGPGSPIEVVFSFDTTGSMYSYLDEVRKCISSIIERLLGDIPAIKIAVIAHGDYCDRGDPYVTKIKDFSNNKNDLVSFVNGVEKTDGGDYPECYELVLSEARRLLSWSPGTLRSLVMIGDAIPHEASESRNEYGIDWIEECKLLRDQLGCRVYSVQANDEGDATEFFKKMAEITGGTYVPLAEIQTIVDLLMAICYREHGAVHLENFRKEVETRELKKTGSEMNPILTKMFAALEVPDTASVTVITTEETTTSGEAAAALLSASAVHELVLWRDVKKSAAVFTLIFSTLLALIYFSVTCVMAGTLLIALFIGLLCRIYMSLLQCINKETVTNPFQSYLEIDITISEEKFRWLMDHFVTSVNRYVYILRSALLIESFAYSIKVALIFLMLIYLGSWFNDITLLSIAFVLLFSVPKVYDMYPEPINNTYKLVSDKVSLVHETVCSKLPFLKKKDKEQ